MIAKVGQELPVFDETLGQPGALCRRQVHSNLRLASRGGLRQCHGAILRRGGRASPSRCWLGSPKPWAPPGRPRSVKRRQFWQAGTRAPGHCPDNTLRMADISRWITRISAVRQRLASQAALTQVDGRGAPERPWPWFLSGKSSARRVGDRRGAIRPLMGTQDPGPLPAKLADFLVGTFALEPPR